MSEESILLSRGLKNCPFCGQGNDNPFGPGICSEKNLPWRFWVECGCGARGAVYGSEKSAYLNWNKRASNE